MSELLQSIAEEYWIKKLRHGKPLSLFYDHRQSCGRQSGGRQTSEPSQELQFAFPSTHTDRLAAVAGGNQASVYLILLSVLHSLVYKYTGESDALVATAGFNGREEEEEAILFFRADLTETITPKELLKKNLAQLNTILEHPALSWDTIQERFGSDEEQGILRQLGFVYEGFNRPSSCLADLRLLFRVTTTGMDYNLHILFQPAFYSKGQVQQLGEHFLWMLSAFLNRSGQPLSRLHILNADEEAQVLATERHHIAQAPQQTLVALFEEQVARFPDKEALCFKGISYTYQQLNTQVNSLASYLREQHQVQPNEVVGLMMPRSSAMVIAILGILKAGAAFLPIESSLPAKRKQYMLENASVKLLLTESDAMFELADYYAGELMALDIQLSEIPVVEANPAPGSEPSDLAYILYTSGSTGEPKGVEIQHQSIVNYLHWANNHYFQHETGHRFALFTAITFDLTLTSLFSSLVRGDGLLVTEDKPIDELLKDLFGNQSTVRALKLTPAHINLLGELGLTSTQVQTVILGGEALHQKQIDILRSLNPAIRIFNEYGPTEATVGCMVKQVLGSEAEITIGKAIDNTSIYLIDAHHALLPVGVAGEIGVSGAGLAKGYLNQPDTTAEKFVSIQLNQGEETFRLYKTGDLGVLLPDGEIRYLGRKDNQVKIRAFRVELGEIENCLCQYPAIKEVVVIDAEDKVQDKFLVAYYIANEVLLVEELRQHLESYLPDYMIPSYFVRVERFSLTPHGKVDRKALPSPSEALSGRSTYVAPTNAMEANLVRIWEEALDVKEVGITDNFFSLGGDSLKAIRVANKIQQIVDETVPFTLLFDASTIQRFSACLPVLVQQRLEAITDLSSVFAGKKDQPGLSDFAIEPIPEADYYEVSHAQGRIWLTAQLEEKQIGYNICGARVLEDIQLAVLEKAFQALVERHESLRTVFINLDGSPKQKILPPDARFNPEYLDMSEEDNKQEKVNALSFELSNHSFDLENGPLFRAQLVQVDNTTYALLFALHHIISDGWTMDVLFKDLTSLYEGFLTQDQNVLPPLAIQYKDYAAWEHQQLQGESLLGHRAYWLAQFAGELPVLELRTDFPRPAVITTNAGTVNFLIEESLRNRLVEFSHQQQVTLVMTLMAALNTLLFRYSNQYDLIIGTPFGGRIRTELENQVGIFLNLLALRTQFSEQETFISLLKKTQKTVLGAFEHQVYPFDRIVKDLELRRNPGRSPLFDVMFSWQNTNEESFHPSEEEFLQQKPDILTEDSKYDLTFIFSDFQKGVFTSIKYNSDLFKKDTIEGFQTRFIKIVESIIANPEIALNEINLGQEREQPKKRESFIKQNFSTKF